MRNAKMKHLFALIDKLPDVNEDNRHRWATLALHRQHNPVTTFSLLTEDEIQSLIDTLGMPEQEPVDYVMCSELSPDDLPCVHDVEHLDRGWPCVDEFGREWVLR